MTKNFKIVLLGSGNVGFHLSQLFINKGFAIHEIYNCRAKSGIELSKNANSKFIDDISKIDKNADLYIIALTDSQIEEVSAKLKINSGVVVHTSGSTNISVLSKYFDNCGVFYPLQTFSKYVELNYSEIPFFIEGNNIFSLKFLKKFSSEISNKVIEINSEQRKLLHISAVFASNFTNFLYTIAEDLLQKANLNFDVLEPLIKETTRKALLNNPQNSQTGPAIRQDFKTVNEHLEVLKNDKNLLFIYDLLSKMIIDKHN